MKIAYLDCFAGISGDMFLGAVLDAGLDFAAWSAQIKELPVVGLEITREKVTRKGIAGTKVGVCCSGLHQPRRNLQDIEKILADSPLSTNVRKKSMEVFESLAAAEAKVHGVEISYVHFHEVGAWDAIADIVGTVLGLEMLQVAEVYCSRIHTGMGITACAHGILPVPAPATAELLKGVPTYGKGVEAELTTPTGAALAVALVKEFGVQPGMVVDAIGYGAGSRELELPNLLRIQIGENLECTAEDFNHEEALLLEANIDDMQPEFYGYISSRLFELGAHDVFLAPIYMKKNRPAVTLSVLAPPGKVSLLARCIFEETTTLGLRSQGVHKFMLTHETTRVETTLGEVQVKLGLMEGKVVNVAPEYEECVRLAREKNLPLKDIYHEIMAQARKALL